MLQLTTGLIENKLASAIDSAPTCVVSIKSVSIFNRPIVTLGVRISNVDTAAASIDIKGYHMDGTSKMEYLTDSFYIDAGKVALRQYYVQFDAFEFQFFPSSQAVEVSAWGLNSAGKSTIAYRVLPAELNSLAGPTAVSEHKGVGPRSSTRATTEIGIQEEQGIQGEQGAQGATGSNSLGVPLIAPSSSQMVYVSQGGSDESLYFLILQKRTSDGGPLKEITILARILGRKDFHRRFRKRSLRRRS